MTNAAQDHTSEFRCRLSSSEQRAAVAERTGIDKCIKYNKRQGANSTVRAKAINALLGAAFLDSGGDIATTLQIMMRLGLVAAIIGIIAQANSFVTSQHLHSNRRRN